MSLLSLSSLKAYYGESQALFDVNLEINEGEIVALMGRNGTGKSTTVKSIFQMIPTRGELLFSGKNLSNLKSFQISRLGAGLVPEGRRIFGQLQSRLLIQSSHHNPELWKVSASGHSGGIISLIPFAMAVAIADEAPNDLIHALCSLCLVIFVSKATAINI